MSYLVTFHCGATMTVRSKPDPRKHKDARPADLRRGMFRVVTWSRGDPKPGGRPKTEEGLRVDCLGCRCRRKAGRQEYQCFPDDYEKEKDGKYAGKRFHDFAVRVVACFPLRYETLEG